MAQTYRNYGSSFLATNRNLFVGNTETIILEHVPVTAFRDLSLTVTNFVSPANNISVVKVYGSSDGINYYTINASALSAIVPASTVNYTFTATALYIRVTATSASTSSNLDCFLVGIP